FGGVGFDHIAPNMDAVRPDRRVSVGSREMLSNRLTFPLSWNTCRRRFLISVRRVSTSSWLAGTTGGFGFSLFSLHPFKTVRPRKKEKPSRSLFVMNLCTPAFHEIAVSTTTPCRL